MALTNCRECKNQVSSKAKQCPKCGAPIKHKGILDRFVSYFIIYPLAFMVGLVGIVHFVGSSFSSAETASNKVASAKPVVKAPGTKVAAATPTKTPAQIKVEKQAKAKNAFLQKFSENEKFIKDFDVKGLSSSKNGILIGAAAFSNLAGFVNEAKKQSLNEQEKTRLKKYIADLSALQSRAFPVFRDAYGPELRKALWELDITAKTFGSRFTRMELVGALFAANKNIKTAFENTYSSLQLLRFKRIDFKWYAEADNYTYWDLDFPEDHEVVVRESGAFQKVSFP